MAWGRILDVYVGREVDDVAGSYGAAGTIKLVGINPDTGEAGLDCEAEIQRSNRMAKNAATVKIYNVNKETRDSLQVPGMVVRIDAGYEDEGFGTVFYGQVDTAESKLTGADWVTTISAVHFRSKNLAFDTLYCALAYAPRTNLMSVLDDISAILGVVLLGRKNADIICSKGWVHTGTMKAALTYVRNILRHNGADIFYDLGELVIYKVGEGVSEFEGVYLDSDCGLLSAQRVVNSAKDMRNQARSADRIAELRKRYDTTKTEDGRTRVSQMIDKEQAKLAEMDSEASRVRVHFTALATHRLRPNALVEIKHRDVKGDFILDDVEFKLSNFSGDFTVEGQASRES